MKFKIFLVIFLVSFPFWWGMNVLEKNLEEVFFRQEISRNPQILTAQLNQQFLEAKLRKLKLAKKEKEAAEKLEIQAESVISMLVKGDGRKVLFEKDSGRILPIASLTKLMTAYVALEYYDLDELVQISKSAVGREGDSGFLKPGEKFRVKDLLYISLMESSNDAAYALSEVIGVEPFVALMNLEAEKRLGLKNTKFVNPTGLEPDNPGETGNYSTCQDLAKFTIFLLQKPLIQEIFSLSEFDLYLPNGIFHHRLKNTNELLDWNSRIIGGKTGWTPRAKGCLVLVLETPQKDGYLINIILGSENRFEEMKKLIDWVYGRSGH